MDEVSLWVAEGPFPSFIGGFPKDSPVGPHLLRSLCAQRKPARTTRHSPCSGDARESPRYESLEGLADIDVLPKAEFISWNPGDQLFDEGEHFRYEAAVIPGY